MFVIWQITYYLTVAWIGWIVGATLSAVGLADEDTMHYLIHGVPPGHNFLDR